MLKHTTALKTHQVIQRDIEANSRTSLLYFSLGNLCKVIDDGTLYLTF